ncbi:transglycosylase SLT domain-containing protein [Desulfobacterales bacterium HSG17]|nr:transglycosylase SLT domain-containing protein [Desulfobacterales bacterium HSG17]
MNIILRLRSFILFFRIVLFLLFSGLLFSGCALSGFNEEPDTSSLKERIEKKWDAVKLSNVSTWIDYSPTLDTRSEINFVKGKVTIETIIPVKDENIKKTGEKQIAEQVKKVFLSGVRLESLVLKDQLQTQDGEVVTAENLDTFIIKEILPKIKIEKTGFIPKDNIQRVKASSQVNLVPKHAKIRAGQYSSLVIKYSKKYDLSPQLMLALIHKESHFNPFAKSYDGALGLMQLMPEYGAKEAYMFLYKKDIYLPESYFYDPENNIELGTAYFHLLKTRYFNKIKNKLKRQYLSICAYNWGPTRVTRLIKKHNIKKMNSRQLYKLLKNNTPEETRKYLENIFILSKKYKKMI